MGSSRPIIKNNTVTAEDEVMSNTLSILIVGHRGLLGQECMNRLRPLGRISGVDIDTCDITRPEQIEAVIDSSRPDWVINGAAYTDVDGCESNRELAWAVNAGGAGNLARSCRSRGIGFVQLSTDFVFDGRKGEPYLEDDVTAPLSVYGASKLGGERAVREAGGRHIIVRTAWLFGKGGKNFPDTILKAAQSTDPLRVVEDQWGSPTYAPDLADAIGELIRKDARGIVHLTNRGSCSWFEYAVFILRAAGIKKEVIPVSTEELPRPARRPRFSVLSLARYEGIVGKKMRPWQEAVKEYLLNWQNSGNIIT